MIDRISLILVITGALNWGSVALFQMDVVALLFGGSDAILSRVIYTLVALAGIGAFRFCSGNQSPAESEEATDQISKSL